jgi:6-phosphogluconolactonase
MSGQGGSAGTPAAGSGGTLSGAGSGGTLSGAGSGGTAGSVVGGSGGSAGSPPVPTKTFVYFGSGSWEATGTGKIQVYGFDEASAALSPVQEVAVGELNSFGAIARSTNHLYMVDEVAMKLRAYSINAADGKLTFVNEIDTGDGPVYATLDASERFLLVAYYGGGNVEVFSILDGGALGGSVDVEFTGNETHSIVLSTDNHFAFVPNKGSDNISQFAFDATSGALTANDPASIGTGDGPRHMAFHPNGLHAYLLDETDSMLTAFTFSNTAGTLTQLDSVSNVPDGSAGKASSDIHVSPDGKFVYATNRDDENTIAMFSVGGDGKLSSLGHESTRGTTPRHFAIHPTAGLVLVANQDSNNLASFRIGADGKLQFIESPNIGISVFWVGMLPLPL